MPALVIALSTAQPQRLGDVALLVGDRPWFLGRVEEGEPQERQHEEKDAKGASDVARAESRLRFGLQRPCDFTETGPLAGKSISRRQLVFTPTPSGMRVECVGKAPLRVNDVLTERATLVDGDVLTVGKALVLLFQYRTPSMPRRAVAPSMLHAFGEPDALGILGESNVVWILREQLAFAAKSKAHVLLHGESGTGKELAARAIHRLSSRADRALVARNAATLPPGLVDAELYGSARNYPNAGMAERPGLVGEADGGTLFLDEIGEMPVEVQAHLLRFLDRDGEHHRLGESRTRRADVRVIGATNRPLTAMKHDVLARLTAQIELPSLNARREDIPLLVQHLLRRRAAESPEIAEKFTERDALGHVVPRTRPSLLVALLRHRYTTNVRELDALLWKAMLASTDDRLDVPAELREAKSQGEEAIDVDDLLAGLTATPLPKTVVTPAKRDASSWTPAEIIVCLQRNQWHQEKTAAALGMTRHTLARRLERMRKDGQLA